MVRISALTSVLALAAASSAMAETDYGNFTLDGRIGLAYFYENSSSNPHSLGFADGNVAFDFGGIGSGGGFGLDLGFSMMREFDGGDHYDGFMPSLTYEFGNNKIWLGQPDSAFRSLRRQLAVQYMPIVELEAYTGSVGLSDLLELEGVDYYGIRYDGTFGNAKVQLAGYDVPDEDIQVYSALGIYTMNNLTFYGAAEVLVDGPDNRCSTWFGAEGNFGAFTGGVGLVNADLFIPIGNIARVYGAYDVNEDLRVNAEISAYLDMGSDYLMRVGATYDFMGNGYVSGGVLTTSTSSDQIYNLEVGMRF